MQPWFAIACLLATPVTYWLSHRHFDPRRSRIIPTYKTDHQVISTPRGPAGPPAVILPKGVQYTPITARHDPDIQQHHAREAKRRSNKIYCWGGEMVARIDYAE